MRRAGSGSSPSAFGSMRLRETTANPCGLRSENTNRKGSELEYMSSVVRPMTTVPRRRPGG